MNPTAFISSTFSDLHEHRAAVFQAVRHHTSDIRGMELFGARPGAPREECLGEVRRAQVFILILGMRYGSIEPDSGFSYTHLEYIEARKVGMPCLVYLMDEDLHPVLPKNVDVGQAGTKLKDFKETVRRAHVVNLYASVDDLARKCIQDIRELLNTERFDRYSNALAETVAGLPRATWLNLERFDYLYQLLGPLGLQLGTREVAKAVLEFLLVGDRQSASFLISKRTGLDFRQSIDLAIGVEAVIRKILEQGMDSITNEQRDESAANRPHDR